MRTIFPLQKKNKEKKTRRKKKKRKETRKEKKNVILKDNILFRMYEKYTLTQERCFTLYIANTSLLGKKKSTTRRKRKSLIMTNEKLLKHALKWSVR
jgi:hypothetical protein